MEKYIIRNMRFQEFDIAGLNRKCFLADFIVNPADTIPNKCFLVLHLGFSGSLGTFGNL